MPRLALFRGWRVGLRGAESQPHASGQTPPGSHLGLQVFFEPADRLSIVDIVFVHGLTGDSYGTWLNTQTDEPMHWPSTLLGDDIEVARILSFGYDADVAHIWGVTSKNRINNYAENMLGALAEQRERTNSENRKILFVAHSLGGLVTENALYLSKGSPEKHISRIVDSTVGILFLGTPHFGADLASWAKFGSKLASILTSSNPSIIAVMQRHSEVLAIIQKNFHSLLRTRRDEGTEISITCFYEELPLPVVGEVVPMHSAILPGYSSYGIHANHMDMVKFTGADDPGYVAVRGELQRWVRRVRLEVASDTQEERKPSTLEFQCLQCLYTSDYEFYKARNPSRTLGTCEWILKHEKFLNWQLEQKSSLLWISGDPGCGKSVMASFLVEELRTPAHQTVLPAIVLHFFFKDDNDNQKNAVVAVCALLHQLCSKRGSLVHYAMEDFIKKGKKFTEEFDTLWKIFLLGTKELDTNLICVIDGLDECEEATREKLIDCLTMLYSQDGRGRSNQSFVKFLLTSRPYGSIERRLDSLPNIRLKAEDQTVAISQDVERVVKSRLEQICKTVEFEEGVRASLEERLIRGADRTFIWVSLTLQMIENSARKSKAALDSLITSIPETLDAVYENILRKSSDHEDAKKILHLVLAATRPLSLKEMNVAFVMKLDNTSYKDIDLEPSIGSTIKDLCGLFVKVIESKIYLVHQTAREFLIRSSNDVPHSSDPGRWRSSLNPIEGHLLLANICTSYLLLPEFDQDIVRPHDRYSYRNTMTLQLQKFAEAYDFLEYASRNWATHFRVSQLEGNGDLIGRVSSLYNTKCHRFDIWFGLYWHDQNNFPTGWSDFMLASHFGHTRMVKDLISKGADLEKRYSDHYSGTALVEAVKGGHESTVRLLVENSAEIETHGGSSSSTPLQAAARGGHEGIVRFLLAHDANVDVRDFSGNTALHSAVGAGHETVTRILIDAKSDLKIKDSRGETMLEAAAYREHVAVVEMLLAAGAPVNAKGGNFGNALQAAAVGAEEGKGREQESIVRLLLAKSAQVNAKGGRYGSPLQAAAKSGNMRVAQLLIEKGADLKAQGGYYGTILQAAAAGGDVRMVQWVLEEGADPNESGGTYGNALQAASESGHSQVVQLLLDSGANINAAGGLYGSALQAAAWKKNYEIVQYLLENGADVNLRGGNFKSVLNAARRGGCEPVVRLLLEHGANIDDSPERLSKLVFFAAECGFEKIVLSLLNGPNVIPRDGDFGLGDALEAAASEGHLGVMRLLLAKGADINSNERGEGAPILRSSKNGHENVVRLLIEKGSNINARGNKYYCNALDAALSNSHESIAELLFENGADLCAQGPAGSVLYSAALHGNEKMVERILRRGGNVNAIGGSYGSPLGGACSRGYLSVVQMLLQYGADVNAQGGEYGNALQAAAGSGDEEIIRLLLDRGAHLHAYTPREGPKTALEEASRKGHDAALKLLLSAEARAVTADAEPNGYGNALHAAASSGHLSTVRLLIAAKADVNAKGKFWDTDEKLATPLYISVYHGNKTIVRELLSSGAEVNAHGGEFGTAYQIAVIERQHSITQLLLAYGADPSRKFEPQIEDVNKCFSTSITIYRDGRKSENNYELRNPVQMSGFMLHRAVDNASVELTKFALEHGTYVDTADGDGMTPLLLSAKESHVQIMELLLDEGADCDAKSKTNRTALHWAAENGDFGALQLLLNHNPSTIDAKEGMWGQTPLIGAACHGNTSAVRQLLTHGANPNIQDNRGDAAIYRAVRYNHILVVRILLLSGARADIQNNKGRTPMWKAQNLGHTVIVNLLKRYTQH